MAQPTRIQGTSAVPAPGALRGVSVTSGSPWAWIAFAYGHYSTQSEKKANRNDALSLLSGLAFAAEGRIIGGRAYRSLDDHVIQSMIPDRRAESNAIQQH